jgi:hypothetical protein
MLFVLASFIVHGAIGASMAAFMPYLDPAGDDSLTEEQYELVSYFLGIDAETDVPPPPVTPDADGGGKTAAGGASSPGEEGAAGDPTRAAKTGRAAVRDNGHDSPPQLSRHAGLELASTFGMVGVLNNLNGDPDAPVSIFGGDFAQGDDPLSAQGNAWSDDIGGYGPGGLSISGIGEGGDGRGDIIGTGGVRTIGIGPGDSGRFAGRCLNCGSRGHKTSVPRVRQQGLSRTGTLPAAVIQRIVRNNFGRFRYCYQRALENNPNLQGRVAVRFVISRSGAVSNVSATGDLPDAGVRSCVAGSFAGLSFPAPEHGVVTVSYPILFSPGS